MNIFKSLLAGTFAVSVCMGQGSTRAVQDADGNVYHTVKIGHQVWTVENLRTTRYNDGSAIPHVTEGVKWAALTTPAYCFYSNTTNSDRIKKYGALYNWYVVSSANPKKIAPAGWHVPTDSEWTILEKYLVLHGYNWDGTRDTAQDNKIAKSLAAKTDWVTPANRYGLIFTKDISIEKIAGAIGNDLTKNNSSGFSALPSGSRSSPGQACGSFNYQNYEGYWWSATEADASDACDRYICWTLDNLYRHSGNSKSCGFSVRLLRDN